jgi:hypothetical protein
MRLPGTLLTVALVAAAGLLAWTRFHHGPLRVTGAVISGQARSGCGVVVTGRIATNGSPGVVSYRWVFTPAARASGWNGPSRPGSTPCRSPSR